MTDQNIFYGLKGQELLDCTVQEVLERHFDGLSPEMIPEQVQVFVHKHRPIDVGRTAD